MRNAAYYKDVFEQELCMKKALLAKVILLLASMTTNCLAMNYRDFSECNEAGILLSSAAFFNINKAQQEISSSTFTSASIELGARDAWLHLRLKDYTTGNISQDERDFIIAKLSEFKPTLFSRPSDSLRVLIEEQLIPKTMHYKNVLIVFEAYLKLKSYRSSCGKGPRERALQELIKRNEGYQTPTLKEENLYEVLNISPAHPTAASAQNNKARNPCDAQRRKKVKPIHE